MGDFPFGSAPLSLGEGYYLSVIYTEGTKELIEQRHFSLTSLLGTSRQKGKLVAWGGSIFTGGILFLQPLMYYSAGEGGNNHITYKVGRVDAC